MEKQGEKAWVVNAVEARNRTCDAIYKAHKDIIEEFNNHILLQCSKHKIFVSYTTEDKKLFNDLCYFYLCLGYDVQPEEIDNTIKPVYSFKIRW